MAKTFKQLVLMGKGGPWEIREKEIPTPGPGQLLVKMKASSICNQTDLNTIKALHPPHDHQITLMLPHHFRQWDHRLEGDPLAKYYNSILYNREPYPTTMGHEGMGVVEAIGPRHLEDYDVLPAMGADPVFQVGDRVASVGTIGGLGEYVLAPARELVKVADNLTDEEASLTEPCMILYNITRVTVEHNDVVCILGQGALGLLALQWAKVRGAKMVITVDPLEQKRKLSEEFGADYVLDPTTQDITAEIDKITKGVGCDSVIECAGEPDSISRIPYIAAWGAKIGCIGACCTPVTLDWSYIHFKGMTVYSQMSALKAAGGTVGNSLLKAMAAMSEAKDRGQLHLDRMITHRIKLDVDDVNRIFEEIDTKGSVVKSVMLFD